ncbi:MAG TPA: hypothetical protein VLL05_05540, partial [Terriglobales bacterium]|nr:hypothetical protein [Terriglobales bacterium]
EVATVALVPDDERPRAEEVTYLSLRNAVMASHGLHAADLLFVDPLFDGWKTDAEFQGGIWEFEQSSLFGRWPTFSGHSVEILSQGLQFWPHG